MDIDTFRQFGKVPLLVGDLPTMSDFYRALLGLGVQAISQSEHLLLAHRRPWLRLQVTPDQPRPLPARPELYHIAFLLAHRADLGWRLP